MSITSLCRVCLSIGRLERIANTQLQTIFEKLTSNQLITGDGRPESVCYMCHRLLQKCCKFIHLSHRAEKTLSQLLYSRIELNQKNLTIKCSNTQNDSPHALTVSSTIYMTIPSENEGSQVFIKKELEERKSILKSDTDNILMTDGVKISNENDLAAKSFDQEPMFDADRNWGSSDIAGPIHKQDVPDENYDVKISNENDSMDRSSDQEPMFDADRDSDSSCVVPAPTTTKSKDGSAGFLDGIGSMKKVKLEQILNSSNSSKDLIEISIMTNQSKKFRDLDNNINQNAKLPKPIKKYKPRKNKNKLSIIGLTYQCDKCSKMFTKKNCLRQHAISHSDTKPFTCHNCFKTFTSRSGLSAHMKIHSGERPHSCHMCAKTFVRQSHLTRHIKTHTGEKPYRCYICPKQFIQKRHLQEHIRTHTGERPHACKMCPKKFGSMTTLKIHTIRIHSDEKPYPCLVCSKNFCMRSELKIHVRSHTGERPYLCDKCPAAFSHRHNLRAHKTSHTGEKPYACHLCARTFARSGSLKRHMRTHTSEGSYHACDHCSQKFKSKQSLQKHIITLHI